MAYPSENLHPNEKLVLDLHPHWWFFTPALASLVGAIVLGLIVLTNVNDNSAVRLLTAVVILVMLVWFGARYVQWTTTDLVLTSDRLIWRTGVVAKRGIEIPLDRINTIFFNQKIWERLIGVGDLTVESASATGAQNFDNMKHPSRIQNEIYIQKEEAEDARFQRRQQSQDHGSEAGAAGGDSSALGQIERLAALRDSGAISDEDYEAKKRELLDRM